MTLFKTTANVSVVSLLLASMDQPELRKVNTYLLRQTVDPQIPIGLINYIDDPDLRTRDAVLYCLATNQQVAIIPYIVKLDNQMKQVGERAESVQALSGFITPEAVPYLNPLVFASNFRTRTEATCSLYQIADKTSIPYLVLALHDPDPTCSIPAAATIGLHRLVLALRSSPLQSQDDYIKHKSEQTKPIYQWWSDELEGRHSMKEEVTKPADQIILPKAAVQLQVMLWNPSVELRRRVMTALLPLADQSTIPYLMLALQDPDGYVAYDAYRTLYHLIGLPGNAIDKEAFKVGRVQESQPMYNWWSKQLQERPLSIPSSNGFIRSPNPK